MNEQKKTVIYQVCIYLTMAVSVVLGLLFIFEAIKIYAAHADPIYSPSNVKEALLQLLPCIILFVLVVIFSGVFITLNFNAKKENVKVTSEQKYKNLIKMFDAKELDKKESNFRLIIRISNLIVLTGCLSMCLSYVFIPGHFDGTKDATNQVITAVVHFLPWVGIAIITSIITTFVRSASYERSIKLIKANVSSLSKGDLVDKKENKIVLYVLQGTFIALAIFLIVFGAVNDGASDVLKKAIKICSECVGLG